MQHLYKLKPYQGLESRYDCPNCNKRKHFTPYIDIETGESINANVGKCDNESKCGYHYTPKQYFHDNHIPFDTTKQKLYINPKLVSSSIKPPSFIPVELLKASLNGYETNNFVKFLIGLFGVEITSQLISRYFIGTSKHWNDATIFWQIDLRGKIRTGQIMLYNAATGKRIKKPFNYITWVHSVLKLPEFDLRQCFYGEHLLKDTTKPVAIVESIKTAIIASVYFPEFIWIATGGISNLNADKCKVLRGRAVTLFPDLNAFEKWNEKASELSHITSFTVSDLLERKATDAERARGLDLSDFLTRFDWKEFTSDIRRPTKIEDVQLINITATNSNGTFRQYIKIAGQIYHLLLHSDGQEVLPNETKIINEVQRLTGLRFRTVTIEGLICLIASNDN
ncbi:DUF6371 domain-containing protein [soil metagenome]